MRDGKNEYTKENINCERNPERCKDTRLQPLEISTNARNTNNEYSSHLAQRVPVNAAITKP